MPLPEGGNTPWVPASWQKTYEKYMEHDAWYSGDANKLAACYAQMVYTPTPRGKHWSKNVYEEKRVMLHVPLAGDIAGTSADLIFSEPPKIKIPDADNKNMAAQKAQDRLDWMINVGGIYNRLIEAAESSAAMGGVFIKPQWDTMLANYPIFGIAQADTAIPEFKWGLLTAVTFWKVLVDDDGVFYRHLERHEPGWVYNGLYKGDKDKLGVRITLDTFPETAGLQDAFQTGFETLMVRYVPNMRPNRFNRGSALGMSDYAGVEGMMDALDETYTSWMRDIRLGVGRLIVPESWMEKREDGHFAFDLDQEMFATLDMDPLSAAEAGLTINQFAIRTQEHKDTAFELIDRIVSAAGYAPQSFGLSIDGRAESGTALNIRERRSFLTKSKKERYFRPVIEDILEMMMIIDNKVFHSGVQPFRPTVEFSDSITPDVTVLSDAVLKIRGAQAASTKTLVMMLHPDWNAEQIDIEVNQILNESGLVSPDVNQEPV